VGVGDGWGDVIRGGCKKEWKGTRKRSYANILLSFSLGASF